jgi:hypothetical protein
MHPPPMLHRAIFEAELPASETHVRRAPEGGEEGAVFEDLGASQRAKQAASSFVEPGAANDIDGVRKLINPNARARLPKLSEWRPHPRYLSWHREECFDG